MLLRTFLILCFFSSSLFAESAKEYDLVIVGGTPAGITAAIAAARNGRTVALLERTAHVGGLPTNGLGATDIGTRGTTAGLFGEFVRRIRAYYVEHYGENSQQVVDCSDGYHFEPKVAEKILLGMLAEQPGIEVRLRRQFDAEPENVTFANGRIAAVNVIDVASGAHESVKGKVFIDATYEGDLAAAAGAPYRLGREDRREFNEATAGRLYAAWASPLGPGSTGLGDNAVQAYNYRLTLTRAADRVPVAKPATYRRDEYVSLIEDIRLNREASPRPPAPQRARNLGRILVLTPMPNGKTDANNQHAAFLSTDLPEENWPWPTSSWDWRDRFAKRLRDYALGLLWFCQNDPELPADFRAACSEWGFARDEFEDNGNFPRQVYVREGRRITGEYLFTAHDALPVEKGKRAPLHRDSIAASHYSLDSHAVRKREPGRVHLDGMFSWGTVPYTIPFGVMVPKNVEGLLVPVAVSATHVGLSTLRMEPCWMSLGEAAGSAAHLALAEGVVPRQVNIAALQRELLDRHAVLIYFRDLSPGNPAFEAAEVLGLRGAIEDWTVQPEAPIDAPVATAWRAALELPPAPAPAADAHMTRGEYLAQLWKEWAR